MKRQRFTTQRSSLERNLGGNNCRRHACWLCPSYALIDPSDVGLESGRTQTRREYFLSSLDGGIPAANGLLFVQTPSLNLAVPTDHSDLGSAKLTLCARDGAAEPPWMGLRRVSVCYLVAVASLGAGI